MSTNSSYAVCPVVICGIEVDQNPETLHRRNDVPVRLEVNVTLFERIFLNCDIAFACLKFLVSVFQTATC